MITHTIENHTCIITIHNPPVNTWTPESLLALKNLTHALDANKNIYAAIITGQGEKFFSAGADLKRFQAGKAAAREFITVFGEAFEAWMNARFVTIAAINGYAMGGGMGGGGGGGEGKAASSSASSTSGNYFGGAGGGDGGSLPLIGIAAIVLLGLFGLVLIAKK